MNVIYTEDNTHVVDSYKYTDIERKVMYILRERHLQHLKVTRTFESYVREWKGHNNLYHLHIARSHTKDVDMQEDISKFEELIWMVIGI